ncbi:ankyrin repeat domain-containing protein [Devosia sp.]|uniref:ankyrin repeat domain-containing protein n=1 Tax=Devosia sp. TaxID=1871048 RepID=UPI003A8FC1A5
MRTRVLALVVWVALGGGALADFQGLLTAARTDDGAAALQLLEAGDDPDPPSWHDGYSPLQFAARNGNLELIAALLTSGADTEYRDHNGERALLWAVNAGATEAVKMLLKAGSPVEAAADPHGVSPLMEAARRGDTALCQLLMAHGARVNGFDDFGTTPIFLAARTANPQLVELLLAAGANPNVVTDILIETPLHYAALHPGSMVAQLLAAGASARVRNWKGQTALHNAAAAGNMDAVKTLIAARALLDARDDAGLTPILMALTPSKTGELRGKQAALLLARYSNDRDRALIAALSVEAEAVARLLIARGVDVNFVPEDGPSMLAAAAGMSRTDFLEEILSRGVDVARFGGAALIAAAENNRHAAVTLLLKAGVAVDARGSLEETPLLVAAALGQAEVAAVLLDAGADAGAVDAEGHGLTAYMAEQREGYAARLDLLSQSRGLRPRLQTRIQAAAGEVEAGQARVRALLEARGITLPAPAE